MKNCLKILLVLSLVFSFSILFAQEETNNDNDLQQLLIEDSSNVEAAVDTIGEESDSFLDKVFGTFSKEEVVATESETESETEAETEIEDDVDVVKTGDIKAYVNVGVVEPWRDPGTGKLFDMGFHVGGGAIVKLTSLVELPVVLDPLSVEAVISYSSFAQKDDKDGVATVIGIGVTPRYDVSDLLYGALGVENPVVGIFGLLGLRYNYHSWSDIAILEDESASSFGIDIGAGVKYNINESIGLDLRFTQGTYATTAIDAYGDYSHGEYGFLLGVTYIIK